MYVSSVGLSSASGSVLFSRVLPRIEESLGLDAIVDAKLDAGPAFDRGDEADLALDRFDEVDLDLDRGDEADLPLDRGDETDPKRIGEKLRRRRPGENPRCRLEPDVEEGGGKSLLEVVMLQLVVHGGGSL